MYKYWKKYSNYVSAMYEKKRAFAYFHMQKSKRWTYVILQIFWLKLDLVKHSPPLYWLQVLACICFEHSIWLKMLRFLLMANHQFPMINFHLQLTDNINTFLLLPTCFLTILALESNFLFHVSFKLVSIFLSLSTGSHSDTRLAILANSQLPSVTV